MRVRVCACVCSCVPTVFTDYLAKAVGPMLAERLVFKGLSRFIQLGSHIPGFDLRFLSIIITLDSPK